jgi:membrane protein
MSIVQTIKGSTPGKTAVAFGKAKGGAYAAGLAFRAFFTMFPLMLGVLSIVGLVIHDPTNEAKVQDMIIGIFPADAHAQLVQALKGVKHNAGLLGVISIVGLIWGGTGLFASMEFALTQIFGSRQRDMLRQRLMGLLMMVIFIIAVLAAASVNNAAAVLPFMPISGFLVGTLVMIALLVAIYRFVPNRTFKFAEIWPGAVVAGILIEILTLVFPVYAKVAHGFNTYGQQFALFFLIATWLFFLSQFLLLGAVFNRVRSGAPEEEGVAAAPPEDERGAPRPVDAIEQVQRGEPDQRPEQKPEQKRERRPEPQRPGPSRHADRRARGALGSLVTRGLLVTGFLWSLVRRRRRVA